MDLSGKKIQEITKKLQNIENRIPENIKLATRDLMNVTYETLMQVFDANNLSNHKSAVQKDMIDNDMGFKIWTNDWVIIFNEYGTGIVGSGTHPNPKNYEYNKSSDSKDSQGRWIYFNEHANSYLTTSGMPAKHMFYDVEEAINKYAKEFYSSAINLALNNEKYHEFKKSLFVKR